MGYEFTVLKFLILDLTNNIKKRTYPTEKQQLLVSNFCC